jgi:hypothetical protein
MSIEYRPEVHVQCSGTSQKETRAPAAGPYQGRSSLAPTGCIACKVSHDVGKHAVPQEQEHVMVEMDPEIGALLLPGMTVTGHFFALSDGSWCEQQSLPMCCYDGM